MLLTLSATAAAGQQSTNLAGARLIPIAQLHVPDRAVSDVSEVAWAPRRLGAPSNSTAISFAALETPQYLMTAVLAAGFTVASLGPIMGLFFPSADSFDGQVLDVPVFDFARVAVPYFVIALDMMQVSALAFLPSIEWSDRWPGMREFFSHFAFGLNWAGEWQIAFMVFFLAVFVVLPPCLVCWSQLSESSMTHLLASAGAATVFNVLFSALACASGNGDGDSPYTSGEQIDNWGLPGGVETCDRGAGAMLLVFGMVGGTAWALVCAVSTVVAMREEEWPAGVYAYLFDLFFSKGLLALWAAVLGFSGRAQDGVALSRLLVAVCGASFLIQAAARPRLLHSARQHGARMAAEVLKLGLAISANLQAEGLEGDGELALAVCVLAGAMLLLALSGLLCCCPCCGLGSAAFERDSAQTPRKNQIIDFGGIGSLSFSH